jgi:hypothetical protein
VSPFQVGRPCNPVALSLRRLMANSYGGPSILLPSLSCLSTISSANFDRGSHTPHLPSLFSAASQVRVCVTHLFLVQALLLGQLRWRTAYSSFSCVLTPCFFPTWSLEISLRPDTRLRIRCRHTNTQIDGKGRAQRYSTSAIGATPPQPNERTRLLEATLFV